MTEIYFHGRSFDAGILRIIKIYNKNLTLERDCDMGEIFKSLAFLVNKGYHISGGDMPLKINGEQRRCCSESIRFDPEDKKQIEDIIDKHNLKRVE